MRKFSRYALALALLSPIFCSADFSTEKTFLSHNLTLSANDQMEAEIVNAITKLDAFYNVGIYGQNTSVANIELGVYWPNHDFLKSSTLGSVLIPEGADITKLYDSHATGTAGIIAGYNPDGTAEIDKLLAFGIAPLTTLHAGAVATEIVDGKANIEIQNFTRVYKNYFETAPVDVISSSWGPTSTNADSYFTLYADALASKNNKTTFVVAAGNDERNTPEHIYTNTVTSLALSYNSITVGALGNPNTFDESAIFSCRGASDFYNPVTKEIIKDVRASVDICAPGVNIAIGIMDSADPANTSAYAIASGTSFATPIVAGAVSLLKSTSYDLEKNQSFVNAGWSANARDTRVIKAVLLNSATKPTDWTNNQKKQNGVEFKVEISQGAYYTTTFDNIIVTNQGLDYTYGAGILDGQKALDQYVGMYTTGTANNVWIFDTVNFDASNLYHIGEIDANKTLTMTLVWFVESEIQAAATVGDVEDITNYKFSNLNLELWIKSVDGTFAPVAISNTLYNSVEHLSVTLAALADYYVRVSFFDMVYGEKPDETFALAWNIIPEASHFGFIAALAAMLFIVVRTRRREKK